MFAIVLFSYVKSDIIPTDNTYFDDKMFFHFVYVSIKKILERNKIMKKKVVALKEELREERRKKHELLEKWKKDEKRKISTDPNTSPEELANLAKSENLYIVLDVAQHPNTSEETIVELAHHENVAVQRAIAERSDAPAHILIDLSKK